MDNVTDERIFLGTAIKELSIQLELNRHLILETRSQLNSLRRLWEYFVENDGDFTPEFKEKVKSDKKFNMID